MPVALIIGATGLVGVHMARHLARQGGWRCLGMGRKPPQSLAACHLDGFISADLRDPDALQRQMASLAQVTHVFYLARLLGANYAIPIQENIAMLRNVLDVMGDSASLQHVQIMHGMKWYGSHMRPFAIPARESDARPDGMETFYYAQRDLLAERQRHRHWTFSTLRPHCVSGVAVDSPSNLMLGLGVYAALMRATGQPLCYPGSEQAFAAQLTYTDAALLADVMHWAAITPAAANQDFNVANGDVFSWKTLWPRLCEYFQVPAGPPVARQDFVPYMTSLAPTWSALCDRHGLQAPAYERLVDWSFVQASFGLAWDQVMSTDKLAALGYGGKVDSEAMIFRILDDYRTQKVLP